MAQSNIYAMKENGDLRLVAEIEGEGDPGLAVDLLLDDQPRMKMREFIVINLDNVVVVEAGEEIVQPRRQMTIKSGNNVAPAAESEEEAEESTDEPEAEAEAETPAPRRRGRPKGSAKPAASKPAAKRSTNGRKRSGTKASPFKANPASAE